MTDAALHIDWQVDSKTIELGKAFSVEVMLRWPTSVEALPFDESSMAPLSITLDRVDSTTADGEVMEVRHYTAYAFALDRFEAAPLALRVRTQNGEIQTVSSRPFALQVERVLGEAADLKAELPAETPALPAPDLRPALIGSVALLAILAAWVVWSRRFAQAETAKSLSPGEQAHQRLVALERAGRTHLQRAGAHELAGLLREYLSRSDSPADTKEPLAILGDQVDFVRFAGPRIDSSRVAGWITEARRLLDAARASEVDPVALSAERTAVSGGGP